MLRRLVHRFSEQGAAGGGAQATIPGFQSDGRSTSEAVQDIELDVDSEEVCTVCFKLSRDLYVPDDTKAHFVEIV